MKVRRKLFLLVCFGLLCISSNAFAQLFAGGNGTEEDPYQIATAYHLNDVRLYLNSYFIQIEDIDLTEDIWGVDEGWQPIGDIIENKFTGFYRGNGFQICSLTINRQANHQALFGFIGGNSVITEVCLANVSINGAINVAAIVANMADNSKIEMCSVVAATINGSMNVAGIAANMTDNSKIEKTFVAGEVNGLNFIGGINAYKEGDSVIWDSYSTARITARRLMPGNYAGGITSYQSSGQVKRCYTTGLVDSYIPSDNAGAVIGLNNQNGVYENIFWNNQTVCVPSGIGNIPVSGQSTYELYSQATFTGFDFNAIWSIVDESSYPYLSWQGNEPERHNRQWGLPPCCVTGSYTYADEHTRIEWDEPAEILELGGRIGFNVYRWGELLNTVLINDCYYEETTVIEDLPYRYQVFAVYQDGNNTFSIPCRSVFFEEFSGFNEGDGTEGNPWLIYTPEDLDNMRNYTGEEHNNKHFKLMNNINLNTPPYNQNEGWLPIGSSEEDSFQGTFDGNGKNIINLFTNRPGTDFVGLFGYTNGAVIKGKMRLTNVRVTGRDFVGSLIGYSNDTNISEIAAQSSMNNGVNGRNYVGGLIGYSIDSNIDQCESMCKVTGSGNFVGGLVGFKNGFSIANCSSGSRTIHGNDFVGGVVGAFIDARTNIVNSTASHTKVTAVGDQYDPAFGIARNVPGRNNDFSFDESSMENALLTITSCYWDMTVSNLEYSAFAIGKTTEEMTQEETFEGWDFDNIWSILENESYPYLSWKERPDDDNFPPRGLSYNLAENLYRISFNNINSTFFAGENDDGTTAVTLRYSSNESISSLQLFPNPSAISGYYGFWFETPESLVHGEAFQLHFSSAQQPEELWWREAGGNWSVVPDDRITLITEEADFTYLININGLVNQTREDFPSIEFVADNGIESLSFLEAPVVFAGIVVIDEAEHFLISWQEISAANSYLVYAADSPEPGDWGEPIAIIIADQTSYSEAVAAGGKKFFIVIASTEEPHPEMRYPTVNNMRSIAVGNY